MIHHLKKNLKRQAPAEQAPVATQTEEVDETKLLKQCLQYVNTHVKKVLTLKQFLDIKWSITKEDVDAYLNGGAPTASNESAASATSEEVAQTPAAPAAVTLEGDFPETTQKIPAMRRAIAKAMVNSSNTAPHVHDG